MKHTLTRILGCPTCRGRFAALAVEEEDIKRTDHGVVSSKRSDLNKEIRSGLLVCQNCKDAYPIINYVPRLLENSYQDHYSTIDSWRDFLRQKFGYELEPISERSDIGNHYGQTIKHFDDQWDNFGHLKRSYGRDISASLDYLLRNHTPSGSNIDFFKDKVILDAGCGHGKYLQALSQLRCEVIGLEITDAVDYINGEIINTSNAHVVQASVMTPPFQTQSFDFVFSLGVVHHTPNTKVSFDALAVLPKIGGYFSVWIYPFRSRLWEFTQNNIRKITTRLPSKLLYYLSYIPVPLLSVFRAYSGTSLANSNWAECAQVVYDFYGPKYQWHHTLEEIEQWYSANHYNALEFNPGPISTCARKIASAPDNE